MADYIQEWERLSVLCDVNETKEMKVGKFIGGLREDLREKLEVMQHLTFETACSSALTYEKYSKKKNTYVQTFRPTPSKPNTPNNNTGNIITTVSTHNKPLNPTVLSKTKERPNVLMKDVMCFKCHSHGHYRNELPNARAFTTLEWTEIQNRGDLEPC